MSLFKQMAITFTLFLALVLTSVMVLNFNTATEFTQHQLYTEAKNTAHSLGLSLAKAASPDDLALMETMINAIFDSGYYERIALVGIDDTPIYVRETKVLLSDVPQWFINTIELESVSAHSDIMMGWHQFGVLEVKGHTGNAYRQLYHTFLELCKTFAILGVLVFGILYALLSLSLQSLKRIAEQARAIIDNAFIIEKKLPFTTEFRSTTEAMNAMVAKVKDIFERENETLKRYHELLYIDAQTKLYNRRYINTTLPDYFQTDTGLSRGAYAMVSIDEAERFKQEVGYEHYNTLIQTITDNLKEKFGTEENIIIARLNESDFFVLAPLMELGDVAKRMEEVMNAIHTNMKTEGTQEKNTYFAGCSVGLYHENETLKSLFSRADYGIMHSKSDENFTVYICDKEEEILTLGREEWKEELRKSMEESRIQLARQSVIKKEDAEEHLLHEEVFLRWLDGQGTLHAAGRFVPIAMRLGLVATLDRYMIEKVFAHIKEHPGAPSLALNLSGDFVKNHENIRWLRALLDEKTVDFREKIWIEIHNTVALYAPEDTLLLAKMLKEMGCHFGLDHFTLPSQGAAYLQELRPAYIKANSLYLHDVFYDTFTGEGRENFTNLIRSLGITLIATNTENQSEVQALSSMGVSHFQGRLIASASPLVS
ncbi:EAL domain-containing protein [Sulfurospirillum sp. T05]|uniref:EAL domain-containing protein n=1 Tax=Sulfurospirillum tamanense TaxID=2813362 RepID=A0ABS2WU61_9BACT|nr:LapD/MoxY N-terminal periplasmic domain-containing protein [Sulfurospirillum tamanensis]MBN2965128.1 EAL domain-containing protein [Sulfurospirillum tamanensis]